MRDIHLDILGWVLTASLQVDACRERYVWVVLRRERGLRMVGWWDCGIEKWRRVDGIGWEG